MNFEILIVYIQLSKQVYNKLKFRQFMKWNYLVIIKIINAIKYRLNK